VPHKWTFQKLNGTAELHEAINLLNLCMYDCRRSAATILSYSDRWPFPPRATDRLRSAMVRAKKVQSVSLKLVLKLKQRLRLKKDYEPLLTTKGIFRKGADLRFVTDIDVNEWIDELVPLFRQARGIASAFSIANSEIDEYMDSILGVDNLPSFDTCDAEGIDSRIEKPDLKKHKRLFNALGDLAAICNDAEYEMRVLPAALLELKASLNAASSSQVNTAISGEE
jgi:hypothetical protein